MSVWLALEGQCETEAFERHQVSHPKDTKDSGRGTLEQIDKSRAYMWR